MPIYEYICRDCGHAFELLVRGEEKATCPSCGRGSVNRQLSVAAAHTAFSADRCPARASCAMPNCSGGKCGMAEWMG
jgi:putative FmdB family regulatory protein